MPKRNLKAAMMPKCNVHRMHSPFGILSVPSVLRSRPQGFFPSTAAWSGLVLLALSILGLGGALGGEAQAKDIELSLWPEGAPGALGKEPKDMPKITVRLPESSTPTGALVICPGGGYGGLAMDHEGTQIVEWANSMGLAAVLCDYRHRGKGYGHPAPLQDAQRAIRLTRAHAKEWNIDPAKIGIIGFSAGGHLVSTVITRFAEADPNPKDPIGSQSCRPDYAILCYPVISMGSSFTHRGSEINLLGPNASQEELVRFASERNVVPDTPPTFLLHTLEDVAVPPENSLVFYQAMVANKIPGELHIYQKGPHGVGLARSLPVTGDWPLACQRWLHQLGMVDRPSPQQ